LAANSAQAKSQFFADLRPENPVSKIFEVNSSSKDKRSLVYELAKQKRWQSGEANSPQATITVVSKKVTTNLAEELFNSQRELEHRELEQFKNERDFWLKNGNPNHQGFVKHLNPKIPGSEFAVSHFTDLLAEKDLKLEEMERIIQGQKLDINKLILTIKEKDQLITELRVKLDQPTADPQNSSKSSSKTLYLRKKEKGNQKKDTEKKQQGAQPGHKRNVREPFKEGEVDVIKESPIEGDLCPNCGEHLERCPDKDIILNQYVLPPLKALKVIDKVRAKHSPVAAKTIKGNLPKNWPISGYSMTILPLSLPIYTGITVYRLEIFKIF
jgi:hypothetical protein